MANLIVPPLSDWARYARAGKQWCLLREITVFTPRNWWVYKQPIRANNDLEGWHNALNRRAGGQCSLPLYLLIEQNENNWVLWYCHLTLTVYNSRMLLLNVQRNFSSDQMVFERLVLPVGDNWRFRIYLAESVVPRDYEEVREVIPRIGPIPNVIPLKLFLDILRDLVFPRGLTDSQSYVPIFSTVDSWANPTQWFASFAI